MPGGVFLRVKLGRATGRARVGMEKRLCSDQYSDSAVLYCTVLCSSVLYTALCHAWNMRGLLSFVSRVMGVHGTYSMVCVQHSMQVTSTQ